MSKLVHVTFEYRDEYCRDGLFHRQHCITHSVEECIKLYGLEECEYKILSVEEWSHD